MIYATMLPQIIVMMKMRSKDRPLFYRDAVPPASFLIAFLAC